LQIRIISRNPFDVSDCASSLTDCDGRPRQRRNEAALSGRVARIEYHRQMRQLVQRRIGGDIARVSGCRFECSLVPHSHKIAFGLPRATIYSADITRHAVGVLGDRIRVGISHNFGNDRKPGCLPLFAQNFESLLLLESLKIGKGPPSQ
jgi:hypothetical protein